MTTIELFSLLDAFAMFGVAFAVLTSIIAVAWTGATALRVIRSMRLPVRVALPAALRQPAR